MLAISVEDASIGASGPYVYGIYAPNFAVLYVGQTISHYGAMGRLAQHLSDTCSNTFRQRLCSSLGVEDPQLGAIEFVAVRLPPRKSFLARSSDYREAVEHLVNYKMIDHIGDNGLPVLLISRTRGNPYTSQTYIGDVADVVTKTIRMWLATVLTKK